ncbi:Proline-serine-threonine phosphatase-interacting protein 2, partial [Actinomortierella wolfii]
GKDDAGYGALTNRMKQAKVTCQEILTMFQARASLEEEYGKKLVKLSRSPLGKDEVGTLKESLDVVRYEIEAIGKSHIELASKIRDQLETALVDMMNGLKDKRKLHQSSIDRTFRNKQLYTQQLIKAKEKYDAECMKTKGLSAVKMTLQGKDLDKVSTRIEKTELASKAADVEYQQSIRQLAEINEKWIIEWKAACDAFQGLEEHRVDYLRTTLWNYANIISTACVADDESCERIRASLEQCDVNQNLQAFIDASGTGTETPDIASYLKNHQREGSDHTSDTWGKKGSAGRGSLPSTPTDVLYGHQHRQLPGPQLIESTDGLLSHDRRSSQVSSNGEESALPNVTLGESQPVQHNMDVALAVGNNLFKIDGTLLQQAESHSVSRNLLQQRRTSSPATLTGYDSGQRVQHMESSEPQWRQQHQQPNTPISTADNVLGISLDASGIVKQNRFPAWQGSCPPSPSTNIDPISPQQQPQQQSTASRMNYPLKQVRSYTLPNSTNPTPLAGLDTLTHRRSLSGIPVERHTPGVSPNARQITPDGKLILFYVRVLYDYEATIPEELALKEGDLIAVLHARDDGWWEGDLMDDYNGYRRGLFPSNFTEPYTA